MQQKDESNKRFTRAQAGAVPVQWPGSTQAHAGWQRATEMMAMANERSSGLVSAEHVQNPQTASSARTHACVSTTGTGAARQARRQHCRRRSATAPGLGLGGDRSVERRQQPTTTGRRATEPRHRSPRRCRLDVYSRRGACDTKPLAAGSAEC
jgi:hypothetical protein